MLVFLLRRVCVSVCEEENSCTGPTFFLTGQHGSKTPSLVAVTHTTILTSLSTQRPVQTSVPHSSTRPWNREFYSLVKLPMRFISPQFTGPVILATGKLWGCCLRIVRYKIKLYWLRRSWLDARSRISNLNYVIWHKISNKRLNLMFWQRIRNLHIRLT